MNGESSLTPNDADDGIHCEAYEDLTKRNQKKEIYEILEDGSIEDNDSEILSL